MLVLTLLLNEGLYPDLLAAPDHRANSGLAIWRNPNMKNKKELPMLL